MGILTNLLSILGNNNIVPALIPTLTFMLTLLIVFEPKIKALSLLQQPNGGGDIIIFSIYTILPVIILSYILTALNPYLLKLFEGYVFFDRFPLFLTAQKRKAQKLINKREKIKEQISNLEKKSIKNKTLRTNVDLVRLRDEYYSIAAYYDANFPPYIDQIMPTSAGNILRASASYAGTRYGIDDSVFWSRLLHVIPDKYKDTINSSRNELSFLLNFSILSIVFYILCLIVIITSDNNQTSLVALISINFRYVGAGLIALLVNWFFNKALLYSVGSYSLLVRSAYDLFRLDLLRQLNLKQPKNSFEEFYTWKNLGELFVLGQESIDFKPLVYDNKDGNKTRT